MVLVFVPKSDLPGAETTFVVLKSTWSKRSLWHFIACYCHNVYYGEKDVRSDLEFYESARYSLLQHLFAVFGIVLLVSKQIVIPRILHHPLNDPITHEFMVVRMSPDSVGQRNEHAVAISHVLMYYETFCSNHGEEINCSVLFLQRFEDGLYS